MSAFAVVYNRSNMPGKPGIFNNVMERLGHRGPDGSRIASYGNTTMGHWHFWTTPEEVGEHQPLAPDGLPFKIVFDGRIDNREELFRLLNITADEEKFLSDAALVLRAYARWGEDCFQNFVGEFALVIFDEQKNEVTCARDPLGDRLLCYAVNSEQVIIASEPWAVANASQPQVDETAAAHYFALKATEDGQTLFKNVYELLPAHLMVFTPSNQRIRRYWQPDPDKKIRYQTDEEYAEEFRAVLKESVRGCMRATTPVSVLMSGGMDSPSVAVLTAQMLAPAQLTTITHVFDDEELKTCDERVYIEEIKQQWNLNCIYIPGDDAWALKDRSRLPQNQNQPDINAYRWLKEREYQRTNQEGMRVLLGGGFGDHLFAAGVEWLADLLAEKKAGEAAREIRQLMPRGWQRNWNMGYMQQAVRRAFNKIPGERFLHRKEIPAAWLTPFAVERLQKTSDPLHYNLRRHSNLLGLWAAKMATVESYYASCHTLELRNPYRNRRLVEFTLALPAYQLYRHGVYKHILRSAMQGLLPEAVRRRTQPTSLEPFFLRGMKKEKTAVQALLQDPQSQWRTYVNSEWLTHCWDDPESTTRGIKATMPWRVVSYENWHRSAFSQN